MVLYSLTSETKCMIFSKASNIKNINFTINSKIIDITKEFKYLGITTAPSHQHFRIKVVKQIKQFTRCCRNFQNYLTVV